METEIIYPIRVLHILHSMNGGGTENVLMNYYRAIDRSKVQFDFLLTDQSKSFFEDEINRLGGKIYHVPLPTINNPIRYINGVRRFFKEHPDYFIVHSHTNSKSAIPLVIAKSYNIPIRISHSHNSRTESGLSGWIRNLLMPFLKVSANVYFSCGEQASEWLYGRKFTARGKVKMIRNVISAYRFKYAPDIRKLIREEISVDEDALVIGHVARFNIVKNHKFSVEILYEILKLRPNSYLLLVGDGPEKENIVSYAEHLGIKDRVIMLGVVPNVYDYEQAMDAFILPSFYEGLPLSIVEAQVSGLPCFTTDGRVSKECSVTDLVEYLHLEDGAKRWAEEIMSKVGKPRIDRYEDIKKAGYDAETSAAVLQNLYIELANNV